TVLSASQSGSPSVQRILFGFVSGSFSGASKTRRQSALELPPPPKITARAGRTAHRDRPATSASAQVPPRIGGVLAQAILPAATKFRGGPRPDGAPRHPARPLPSPSSRPARPDREASHTSRDSGTRGARRVPGTRLATARGGRSRMSLRYALLALLAEGE